MTLADLANLASLMGSQNGKADSQFGHDFQGLQVHRSFRQPHPLRRPLEAMLKVPDSPEHLSVLIPAVGQGHNHVVVSLGQGRAVPGEVFLALTVGRQDGLINLWSLVRHTGQ